ncbi:MAG: C10 family peptidase [Bacteroidales bacterium]|nr:C10 family peptidase [Bacteroidales bacterium]
MRKTLFTLFFFATVFLCAQPVSVEKAYGAARQYMALLVSTSIADDIAQMPYRQYVNGNGYVVMNVFNIGDYGFVITGADRSFSPIVGYSFNGAFDTNRLPDNLKAWLEGYVDDVVAVKNSNTKSAEIIAAQRDSQNEWDALERGGSSYYDAKDAKAVEALVETRWDQGAGYNNYCPEYNGGHSVTGCVATAMAQIIRYHRYPTTGYYHSSYTHITYGLLRADYDSAVYDYSLMPVSVSAYSNAAQQNAVSLLCYHCGISVKMNYENPTHTSGSGAHSEDVPNALKHFGYLNSFYLNKNAFSSKWDSLLRHDLDLGRPVYYSGSNSEGGHAFVCDGYRNNNRYHFNFGWSGYGDGFYTLTSVNGYSSSQGAVFNIVPCNMGIMRDTLYIAADGTGDGSSWESAYPNLEDALTICGIYKNGNLWVKNGVYLGHTDQEAAFTIPRGITIYGGFAGHEASLGERNLDSANTVLSGDNKRQVVQAPVSCIDSKLYDVILANGKAETASAISVQNNLRMERCIIENNVTTGANGAAAEIRNGSAFCCIVRNNQGNALSLDNGTVKNSLIVHNNGSGINASNSTVDGCNIVCNSGVGIANSNTKIRNTIIWRNDSSLTSNNISKIFFSAIEGFGETDSNSNFGLHHDNRPLEGIGPFFVLPDTTVGPADEMGDWRLSSLSPLVNAGDTTRSGSYTKDLAGGNRFRSGRVDIGCYEQDPYVGMETSAETQPFCIYPNPASQTVVVEGDDGEICIYDIAGRKVLTHTYEGGRDIIDVSSLRKGVYLIRSNQNVVRFIKM